MSPTSPYGNAAAREARRGRIVSMIRGGARYDEIAAAEGISRQRVRQIAALSLERASATIFTKTNIGACRRRGSSRR